MKTRIMIAIIVLVLALSAPVASGQSQPKEGVYFSDGTVIEGRVFLCTAGWGFEHGDEYRRDGRPARVERIGRESVLTTNDGKQTRLGPNYLGMGAMLFVFVKTPHGWRPDLGEKWPDLRMQRDHGTSITLAVFGEAPSPAEHTEFKEYLTRWLKDAEVRFKTAWGEWIQKEVQILSRSNRPAGWNKWPEKSRQCYRNLLLIREVTEQNGLALNYSVEQLLAKDIQSLFDRILLPMPQCPLGGVYSHGTIVPKIDPRCSVHGSLADFNGMLGAGAFGEGARKFIFLGIAGVFLVSAAAVVVRMFARKRE